MKKPYLNPTVTVWGFEATDIMTASVQHAKTGWGDTLNLTDFEDDPL